MLFKCDPGPKSILDSSRTWLEVSHSLALHCLSCCIVWCSEVNAAWLLFCGAKSRRVFYTKKTWVAMECHSTIVRSPNPTSPLKHFLGQLHTSFMIIPVSNRHVFPSVLLLQWMMSISDVLLRKKILLRVVPQYINRNLFSTPGFCSNMLWWRENGRKTSCQKNNLLS